MSVRFQHALETLYGLERGPRGYGLDGIRRLLEPLDHPEHRFRAVHVAGTNGKGSVCSLIERTLRSAGHRTGLFTSPHLVDFRERIRVSGRWADEAALVAKLERIQALEAGKSRTFFEVCTALAFSTFADAGVEWGVVEVGLGGRLDCTNVITPELAVITSVGLDHTEVLGGSYEAVAAEKAGIIKPGVPVVSGVGERTAASEVVESTAAERGAPLIPVHERIELIEASLSESGARLAVKARPWGRLDLGITLRGRHQLDNARVALAALATLAESGVAIPAAAVRDGFASASWPGRLEPCRDQPRLWWDGAHNPDGAARLARAWREDLKFDAPAALVLAVSKDKDAIGMLAALRPLTIGGRLIATRIRGERFFPPVELARLAESAGVRAEVAPEVAAATDMALELAGRHRRALLAGSLFAVGEAMESRGGAPGEWL